MLWKSAVLLYRTALCPEVCQMLHPVPHKQHQCNAITNYDLSSKTGCFDLLLFDRVNQKLNFIASLCGIALIGYACVWYFIVKLRRVA